MTRKHRGKDTGKRLGLFGMTGSELFMMTSPNGTIFGVTGSLRGNPPVTGEFPSQRPVTRSFDVFLNLRLNKRLSKQSRRRWFETPSRSLRRHCNMTWSSVFLHIFGLTKCFKGSPLRAVINTIINFTHSYTEFNFRNFIVHIGSFFSSRY